MVATQGPHPTTSLPSPLPAAGRGAAAAMALDGPIPNTTSRLAPSAGSERLARAREEHMLKMTMTMPLAAHSPLASSRPIAPLLHSANANANANAPSPPSGPPPAFHPGSRPPPASYLQQPQGAPPITSYPPAPLRPPRSERGGGGLFALICSCLVVPLAFSYYWLRVRGH